jgi:hypothetical protein
MLGWFIALLSRPRGALPDAWLSLPGKRKHHEAETAVKTSFSAPWQKAHIKGL